MNDEGKVYSAYTPFRNHLRQTNVINSLLALHSHFQHFQFDQPLPAYIRNCPFGYEHVHGFDQLINFHLYPWELEIIAKELILHGDPYGERKTLQDWNYLSGAVNKLKSLEEEITKIYITTKNVLGELSRISHRQFSWERKPTFDLIARYWKIYSHTQLSPIVESSIGISASTLYLIGFALIGVYQDKFALNYPPKIELPRVSQEDFDKFLEHFSIPLNSLKEKISTEQNMNEKYAYAYSSLRAYPLIRTTYQGKESLICPIPGLLFKRLSEGLYYELCNKPGFDTAYGQSFQDYVGRLSREGNPNLEVIPEKTYGNPEKRTTDWFLCDDETLLFVECKGKRLTLEAKISLLDDTAITQQISILADAVIQIYKCIRDYQNNQFVINGNQVGKIPLPLVVTLEEWYLFGDKLTKILDAKVREKLEIAQIPDHILESNPYNVCSLDNLNYLVRTSKSNRIRTMIIDRYNNRDGKQWQLDVFLQHHYPIQQQNVETTQNENHLEQMLFE